MELKTTLYQTLPKHDKQEMKQLTDKYKRSDCTLADIFNVSAETYKNISLSQLHLSARILSGIKRFNHISDLADLLNTTLPQLWKIKNIGEIAINELMLLVQIYIRSHTEPKKYDEPTSEDLQALVNAIHSQGRSVKEITTLLEKNKI